MDDITVVVGIDAKTVRQLVVTWQTWRKNRPEMWGMPWMIFFDGSAPNGINCADAMEVARVLRLRNCKLVQWPVPGTEANFVGLTQRERMLSGFVHAPPIHVETAWWMKIDTDSLALRESDWLDPVWFETDDQRQHNAWIASAWGYTKPADQMARLDAWADQVPGLQSFPRLNLPFDPASKRCVHSRMASWLSFYNTAWSERAQRYCASLPAGRIPVPSQDGYHFYVAQRRCDRYAKASMKRRGWTNCPKFEKLVDMAEKVLRG